MVYVDGQWQNFDTTPSNWADLEDEQAQGFTFINDFFSWGWLQIRTIFGQIFTPENIQKYWWILLPILLIRLWFSTTGSKEGLARTILKRGLKKQKQSLTISKFSAIEKTFNDLGFSRSTSQPLGHWIQELKQNQTTASMAQELDQILALYYGDRFDPQGLEKNLRRSLDDKVEQWLKKWQP